MDVGRVGLFDLAERRLSWLDRRQGLLAQNIANADTPGWRPRDLGAFDAALGRAQVGALNQTRANHLAGSPATAGEIARTRPAAHAPDGNAVSIDEQLMKVADTETSQELVTNLYTKYLAFFRLALGRAQ